MKTTRQLVYALPLLISPFASAEMRAIDDMGLSQVAGQGGVYLSGEFAINKSGGPLWENGERPYYSLVDHDNNSSTPAIPTIDGSRSPDQCENGICGLRFAIKLNENSEGWYILDDVSGGLAFEGLTLQTETLTSAINYDVWDSSGNFQQLEIDDEVLKIGLPGVIRFNNLKFKFAVANNGEFGVDPEDDNGNPLMQPVDPAAPGGAMEVVQYRQTDIFGVELDGNVTVQGNLLLFPVD